MCAASSATTQQDQSLIALASHLAQVQFRLRQVIAAPDDDKEVMLKELEEFALKGCHGDELKVAMERADESSQSELLQKQCVIIDELSNRLDMQFGDLSTLGMSAVRDEVVANVTRLEQRINELRYSMGSNHGDSNLDGSDENTSPVSMTSHCPQAVGDHTSYIDYVKLVEQDDPAPAAPVSPVVKKQPMKIEGFGSNDIKDLPRDEDKQHQINTAIVKLLSLLQCGCGLPSKFGHHSNMVHPPGNVAHPPHISKALQSLSTSLDRINLLVRMTELDHVSSIKMATIEVDLHTAVTMEMADSLLYLLSDGILQKQNGIFSKILGYSSPRQQQLSRPQEVWSLFMSYCHDKQQTTTSTHPSRSIAFSFDLPLSDKMSPKKTLVHVIHLMDKCEHNTTGYHGDELKFRGLVCKGFNLKHLSSWIQLLSNHDSLLRTSYSPHSFALQTGLHPIIMQLKTLSKLSTVPQVSLPSNQSSQPHLYHIT